MNCHCDKRSLEAIYKDSAEIASHTKVGFAMTEKKIKN